MKGSVVIKGVDESKYPGLYNAVEKAMKSYSIRKIRVIILPWGVNAFALSLIGDYLFIARRILEIMDDKELEVIIAHEFSHIFNRDSLIALVISLIFGMPLFYFSYLIEKTNKISPDLGLLYLFSLLLFLYGLKVRNRVTLKLEIIADREAVIKTKNPDALKKALLKLYFESSMIKKRPGYLKTITTTFDHLSWYFYGQTHPHLKERIELLEFAEKFLVRNKNISSVQNQTTKNLTHTKPRDSFA